MKIGVTAASGRLGHAILPVLAQATGAEAVAIARDPARVSVDDVERRRADYESPDELSAALEGLDTVVLISAPVKAGTDRVEMHRNVIAAACRSGVRKLIYTSVVGEDVPPETLFYPTQQVNRATEALVRDSGLEWIVARNGLYLDLDLQSICAANDEGVYRNNGGDGRSGYVTIAELGYALAQLALRDDCNGEVLNLTGDNLTQAELIALANEVFGLDVRYEPITTQQCIDKFMAIPAYAERGIEVANMLAGCFDCMQAGGFDVPSDFARAAGRPVMSTREQMLALRDAT
jgi:NAD(P)H dehydrogenase (quinone)